VIAYQKKAKLFTNANLKLNIDTEAINELFNYGGEKGQIMMSEDEELLRLEQEIEELASMCLAAMNRKRPSDPIKYENKREKQSFESKFLDKGKNPRAQFMTPQSVRGIKKIELSDESSKEIGDSEGSQHFTGLKSGLLTSNTILEEMSNGSSKSSSGGKDIHFPGLLSTNGRDSIIEG